MNFRDPEYLFRIGLRRSSVVMVNEAHDGLRRCVRTRVIGRRLLPIAHRFGVRHLAMEALCDRNLTERANAQRQLPAASGYLAQPEMRALIQGALDLGWTLISYEADMTAAPSSDLTSAQVTNWRELEQARNLAAALPDGPLLVWCGNGHLSRAKPDLGWQPMACRFQEVTGVEPFALDQTVTVLFEQGESWVDRFRDELAAFGGTAGFLRGRPARMAPVLGRCLPTLAPERARRMNLWLEPGQPRSRRQRGSRLSAIGSGPLDTVAT